EFAQWSAAQGNGAMHDPFAVAGADAGLAAGPLAAQAAGAGPAGNEPDGRREPGGSVNELMLQPAFLRDLFEKKIFSEYGLTRPSRSQYLARPVMSRALRWGGIALLGGWGIGLVVATVQLSHRNGELVAALGTLHRNAQ